MGHKNRNRKKREERDANELAYEYYTDTVEELKKEEREEIQEFVVFLFKMLYKLQETDLAKAKDFADFAWSQETICKCYSWYGWSVTGWKAKNCKPKTPSEWIVMYMNILALEGTIKQFESLFTYVRFLKLFLSEERGGNYIVSEQEQKDAKRWVHMQKILSKWDICVKMATPESKDVWKDS